MAAPYWPRGVDLGTVDPDKQFRALIVFKLRNQGELEDRIAALYNPSSSQFRQYLTSSEIMERYAPTLTTVNSVKSWLTDRGFQIARTARNRMMLSYTGTVRQFNAAFRTRLHLIKRSSGTWRAAGHEACRFIMSPPWRLSEHLSTHRAGAQEQHAAREADARIPEFFQRKRLEDKLRRNQRHIEVLTEERAQRERLLAEKDQELAALRAALAAAPRAAQ